MRPGPPVGAAKMIAPACPGSPPRGPSEKPMVTLIIGEVVATGVASNSSENVPVWFSNGPFRNRESVGNVMHSGFKSVLKFAEIVESTSGTVMVWAAAPPSDQFWNSNQVVEA